MVKPEWGTKRVCPGCGVRFYDLRRRPIVCPGCESSYGEEAFVRNRRSRSSEAVSAPARPKPEVKAPVAKAAVEPEADASAEPEADASVEPEANAAVDPEADAAADPLLEVESDDDDDGVMEDVSDLGEDDDDVAEVVEKPAAAGDD